MAQYQSFKTEKQKFPKLWERYQTDLNNSISLEKLEVTSKDAIFNKEQQRIYILNNHLFTSSVIQVSYDFINIENANLNFITPIFIISSSEGFQNNLNYVISSFTYAWKSLGTNHFKFQARLLAIVYDPNTFDPLPDVSIYANLYLHIKNPNIWQSITKSKS